MSSGTVAGHQDYGGAVAGTAGRAVAGGLWRLRSSGMSGSDANTGAITCQPSGAAVGSEEGPEEATHSIVLRDVGGSIRYGGGTCGRGHRTAMMAGVLEGGIRGTAAMTLSEFHANLADRASQCWASVLYVILKCFSGIRVPLFWLIICMISCAAYLNIALM